MSSQQQNRELTFRANSDVGRHGWLRLTPAYGVRLVRDRLAEMKPGAVVTDPFSGSGTTALAAAELGHRGQALDINPFLVWLGNMKCAAYQQLTESELSSSLAKVLHLMSDNLSQDDLWRPRLANIERWWPESTLQSLAALRKSIADLECDLETRDLLLISFCRTLIAVSNAAFNHQSMSFKSESVEQLAPGQAVAMVRQTFEHDFWTVVRDLSEPLPGSGTVFLNDSRGAGRSLEPCDAIITSPPYVNRMSYIRELRPYMYWLGYLDAPADAGSLDWEAIGGTWGTATSKLLKWTPSRDLAVADELETVAFAIERDGGKNGPLLAQYVRKYFEDMALHFEAARLMMRTGGSASYIVGNSTFYGHVVPAERWYATLMTSSGFGSVSVQTIRKRNSKKELFEFDVSGTAV